MASKPSRSENIDNPDHVDSMSEDGSSRSGSYSSCDSTTSGETVVTRETPSPDLRAPKGGLSAGQPGNSAQPSSAITRVEDDLKLEQPAGVLPSAQTVEQTSSVAVSEHESELESLNSAPGG